VLKPRGKKDLLLKFVANRTSILDSAAVFDSLQDSNLAQCLSTSLPITCNQASNNTLSTKMVALPDPLQLLYPQLLSQEEAGEEPFAPLRNRNSIRTREAALVLLEEFVITMEHVDLAVHAQQNSSDRTLCFAACHCLAREPNDEVLRKCLFCGCPSINEQPENRDIVATNTQNDSVFSQKNAAWTRFLAVREKNPQTPLPKDPITNIDMKRAPTRVTSKSPILQCMCSTSKCVMQGSDVSSTCPIGCIDNATHARYPFTGAPNQSCSVSAHAAWHTMSRIWR